ncbi:MAG: putative MerR family transcriptional regulator [Ilumatobacteraceae bacterium]|nr:putative MerR family transcriptional regulator [Ilumatobacteraceae bacterium]
MSIGEFAQQTHLTPKALRIYDDLGLLTPARVDPATGYRRYDVEQIRLARLIGLLRGADLGLAEIGALLEDLEVDRDRAAARLDVHLGALEAQHSGRRALVRHIHSVLREDEPSMNQIRTRHVAAQRVMTIQRRLHAHQTAGFVAEARAAFAEHLGDIESIGPFTLIFHGIVDDESDGPIEAVLGCPESMQPSARVGIRTEPAHDEAYTTITKAEWAYPAILAAYDAVACSPEAQGRPGSALSCREVYLVDPDTIGDDELVCDIAFPLA